MIYVMAKKNWLACAALMIFEICAAYALFSGIMTLAAAAEYPYLRYAGTILALAAALAAASALLWLPARFRLGDRLPAESRAGKLTERIFVAAVLTAAAAARLVIIARFPVAPASDYETYYNVAVLLAQGRLGASGYSGYIAEFPHVIGYPFVLSLLFRLTGPSVTAGLYLNAAASLLSAYFVYRIARRLGGRLGGFAALLLAAFWPSQLLYGAILASEPVFTCLLLLAAWLFLYLYDYPATLENVEGSVFLCVAAGVLIALSAAVRPLSQILLIAAVLCLLPRPVRFGVNERLLYGLVTRTLCQGWARALIILLTYLLGARLLNAAISNTIEYKLPGATVSYGYNLMVGVNIQAKGAWNREDAEFFSSEFARTNSADAAHRACLGAALRRIGENPVGVLNLAAEKYTFLWGNDDYADYWVSLFLGQQDRLTPERQALIEGVAPWNDALFIFCIFLSALYGARRLRHGDAGAALVFVLLVVGTALLHMILENQNRYHYFLLPVLAVLASAYLSELYGKLRAGPAGGGASRA